MRISAKLGLTALAAALLLASAVSTASARNLSLSSQNMRVTWQSLEFASPIVTVRCQVTLEGSFHTRTIAKATESLIGAVTRVDILRERCTNGSALPKTETLPWHITYEGFSGTLPSLTGIFILLSRFRFLLSSSGLCTNGEYGTATDNVTGRANREAGGAVTTLEPVEGRNTVNLVRAQELCPGSGRMKNAAPGTVLQLNTSSTRITVTLI